MRDVWLTDDEPGCLECGSLVFKASRVPGVCAECIDTASSVISTSSHGAFEDDYGSTADYSNSDGDDIAWNETY